MMQGTIEIGRGKMASYLGDLIERIAIDHILINHRSIIKEVYPNQSEYNNIQVLRTNPDPNGKHSIGKITGKRGSWIVHGWNGDLVLILHDDKYGKRAIIFEIKFGKIHLSSSQQNFFRMASTETPSKFMYKLSNLKIYIFHCQYFNWENNKINFDMYEYMPYNLKEFFKQKEIRATTKPEIMVGKKKVKKKKKKVRRLSISGLKKYRKKSKKRKEKKIKKKRSLKVQSRRKVRREMNRELIELDMDDDIYDIE